MTLYSWLLRLLRQHIAHRSLDCCSGGNYRRATMYFSRRQQLGQLEKAEADGESFWTVDLVPEIRNKWLFASVDVESVGFSGSEFAEDARNRVLRDLGLRSLAGFPHAEYDIPDMFETSNPDIILSYVEALYHTVETVAETRTQEARRVLLESLASFAEAVNTSLSEHRVSYDFVDGRFIPFESRVLHKNIVLPVLNLLAGDQKHSGAETAYKNALGEIHDGKPEDAITDAGTALQEMLTSLGCQGNKLGPLIADARKRGMLGSHDPMLTGAIQKALKWASADRSNMGDGHNATSAEREDAWLMVHIVGALILRLASDTPRGS